MPINRQPTAKEQKDFFTAMDTLIRLPAPKRITVNLQGRTLLNTYFESRNITGPIRKVPVTLVEDQFSPYVGHNT